MANLRTVADLHQIEEFFHTQIPMTRAMGVRVVAWADGQLILEAPLELNHNHLGTAFGGSLSAVATLAGYGLLWLELDDPACHVVIRRSALSFVRPVRRVIRAICHAPEPEVMAAFRAEFALKQRARIVLKVCIEEEGKVAVEFEGTFVATK